jgi:translation initiation factor 2 beta subunit (eIF-2beta)/eIF-5
MNRSHPYFKSCLALFALTTSLCLAKPASAQNPPAPPAQDPGLVQDRDRDINRPEIDNFNRFLDSHPEIAEQLRRDPSLVDNRDFVKNHPALETYLRDHPAVRDELKAHPDAFMHAEDRLDRRENNGNGINRQEVDNFNRFLDNHHEIADQLRRDPSLVDNREFLQNHPDLETYLRDHPGVREELKTHPETFMRDEDRLDRRDDSRNQQALANFNHFLDSHREIAEQLQRDPSLADSRQFLQNHPALQTYLQDHPEVRDEIRNDPNAFMQAEARYEHHDEGFDRDHRYSSMDRDTMHRQFGEFLGGHSDVAQQLAQNPALVKDQQFLQNHPELQDYLNQHPDQRQELLANPDDFVKSSQAFNTNGSPAAKTAPAKPKPNQ